MKTAIRTRIEWICVLLLTTAAGLLFGCQQIPKVQEQYQSAVGQLAHIGDVCYAQYDVGDLVSLYYDCASAAIILTFSEGARAGHTLSGSSDKVLINENGVLTLGSERQAYWRYSRRGTSIQPETNWSNQYSIPIKWELAQQSGSRWHGRPYGQLIIVEYRFRDWLDAEEIGEVRLVVCVGTPTFAVQCRQAKSLHVFNCCES